MRQDVVVTALRNPLGHNDARSSLNLTPQTLQTRKKHLLQTPNHQAQAVGDDRWFRAAGDEAVQASSGQAARSKSGALGF